MGFTMVKIAPLSPLIPKNADEFCTNPYDVIEEEEEMELKKIPHSLVHLILPDGEGDEKYSNAAAVFEQFREENLFDSVAEPSIFVYHQESSAFSQEGFILGISLEDYEQGNIIRHENTREKPLQDRIKIYEATKVIPGLVWTVYRQNPEVQAILEQIKQTEPVFQIEKYGYTNILWKESDPSIIANLQSLMQEEKVFIADGHHRCAAAAAFRRQRLEELGDIADAPWQNVMAYMASDHQVRILPYNRLIKKLPMKPEIFLKKLESVFEIKKVSAGFNPKQKHESAMWLNKAWYLLKYKGPSNEPLQDLDVSILQERVLDPILNIRDPRSDENIAFIGGLTDPKEMENAIQQAKGALFFNLYPVSIFDLESIAENGEMMPPKSTWFDPKLLSGMLLNVLM
jgi:uncharacterized protein (DUF1015 family)